MINLTAIQQDKDIDVDTEYFISQSNRLQNLYDEIYLNGIDDFFIREAYSKFDIELQDLCDEIDDFIGLYCGFLDDEGEFDLYKSLRDLTRLLTPCRNSVRSIRRIIMDSIGDVINI